MNREEADNERLEHVHDDFLRALDTCNMSFAPDTRRKIAHLLRSWLVKMAYVESQIEALNERVKKMDIRIKQVERIKQAETRTP